MPPIWRWQWSAMQGDLVTAPVQTFTVQYRSFAVVGTWNELPSNLLSNKILTMYK